MADAKVNEMEAYQKDSRIACQYGAKCYQKNPVHHQKYKHPPATVQKQANKQAANRGQKRKTNSRKAQSLQKTKKKKDEAPKISEKQRISPTPSLSTEDEESSQKNSDEDAESSEEERLSEDEEITSENPFESPDKTNSESSISPGDASQSNHPINKSPGKNEDQELSRASESKESLKYKDSVANEKKNIIKELFLLEMPVDFYQFYEFCCSLSPKAPESALKTVGLEIVGPFEVLCGKIKESPSGDKEKFLRHWRYFYDPPEFQTILRSNGKDGLHFGYWRDEDDKLPVFVAKNIPKQDCKIIPVGENIFAALLAHTEERLKIASPFDKANVSRLIHKIKSYAKNLKINLEQETLNMRSRNRRTVTKTFHLAGIVVPYDKKTQIGYRTLAATDSQLKAMLAKLGDKDEDEDVKQDQISNIEEIVRLATIAADECDFGTPLELAHNLFSSGVASVQKTALQLFTMSYNLLHRPIFLKIAEAHMKSRKNELNLSCL